MWESIPSLLELCGNRSQASYVGIDPKPLRPMWESIPSLLEQFGNRSQAILCGNRSQAILCGNRSQANLCGNRSQATANCKARPGPPREVPGRTHARPVQSCQDFPRTPANRGLHMQYTAATKVFDRPSSPPARAPLIIRGRLPGVLGLNLKQKRWSGGGPPLLWREASPAARGRGAPEGRRRSKRPAKRIGPDHSLRADPKNETHFKKRS